MTTYIALYKGQTLTVEAKTAYEAQTLAAKQFKVEKQYEVDVYRADNPINLSRGY